MMRMGKNYFCLFVMSNYYISYIDQHLFDCMCVDFNTCLSLQRTNNCLLMLNDAMIFGEKCTTTTFTSLYLYYVIILPKLH